MIKIGVFRNLETHSVESGRISFTQNDTVPVEFVESLEEGAPTLHAYKIESNSVAVVQDGLFEVENPQLHVPRAQYTSSEERRVGKEGVSMGRSRWYQEH